jgi:hypothetical protein
MLLFSGIPNEEIAFNIEVGSNTIGTPGGEFVE